MSKLTFTNKDKFAKEVIGYKSYKKYVIPAATEDGPGTLEMDVKDLIIATEKDIVTHYMEIYKDSEIEIVSDGIEEGMPTPIHYGTMQIITPKGVICGDDDNLSAVYDNKISLEYAEKDASIGRMQDGYWVGVKIVAPTELTDDSVVKFKSYQPLRDSQWSEEKEFSKCKDGDFFMESWVYINKEIIDKAISSGTNITKEHKFDWNGTGSFEQSFTISVNPRKVHLKEPGVTE